MISSTAVSCIEGRDSSQHETNMTRLLRRFAPLGLAALFACGSDPIDPGNTIPRSITSGRYELVAPGESRSQAWDTWTVLYEGILTIEQDPLNPSRLSGTFSEMENEFTPAEYSKGILTGTIDERGIALVELRSHDSQFVWKGRGTFVGTRINGQWATNNDEAGGFTAVLAN